MLDTDTNREHARIGVSRSAGPAPTVEATTATIRWRWSVAISAFLVGGLGTATATGIPTDLIPNPWFARMTPIQGYAYPVWGATTLLAGALLAVHLGMPRPACATGGRSRAAGAFGVVGSFIAVGCPVCNKLVVAAIGTAGATGYFAPLQPTLAGTSLFLLVAALAVRLRAVTGGLRAP